MKSVDQAYKPFTKMSLAKCYSYPHEKRDTYKVMGYKIPNPILKILSLNSRC